MTLHFYSFPLLFFLKLYVLSERKMGKACKWKVRSLYSWHLNAVRCFASYAIYGPILPTYLWLIGTDVIATAEIGQAQKYRL